MTPNYSKFKKGDIVRVKNDYYHIYRQDQCNLTDCEGQLFDFYDSNIPYTFNNWQTQGIRRWTIMINNQLFLVKESEIELLQEQKGVTKFMKLNSMMRRLLNADIKKLIKAGLMNGDLLLTEEGRNALYALLVETHKKELVEIAKEILKEEEEDK